MYRQVSTVQGVPVNKLVKDGVYVRTVDGQSGDVNLTPSTQNLQEVTNEGAVTTVESTFSTGLITPQLKASTSAGQTFQTNSGSDWLHGGNGGSANATMYGGWNYDNATANTIASFGASKTLQSASVDSTLSFSTNTLGLNLGNANTWTGLHNFNAQAKVYSDTSSQQLFLGTLSGGLGYWLGRNSSTGFLDITGTQGSPFDGVQVAVLRASSSITIAGEDVTRNWSSSLGLGSGSGTASAVLEVRGSTQNFLIGGGTGYSYEFKRNSGNGVLEIKGQQYGYTGYRFGTASSDDDFVIKEGGNVGFGVASANISAKLHIVKTTLQQRTGYDASNYFDTTVGSTGAVTFDAVGSGSSFKFKPNTDVDDSFQIQNSAGTRRVGWSNSKNQLTIGDGGYNSSFGLLYLADLTHSFKPVIKIAKYTWGSALDLSISTQSAVITASGGSSFVSYTSTDTGTYLANSATRGSVFDIRNDNNNYGTYGLYAKGYNNNSAPSTSGASKRGVSYGIVGEAQGHLSGNGGAGIRSYSASANIDGVRVDVLSGQTAPLFRARTVNSFYDSSQTVADDIMTIDAKGGINPASMADSSANNNSIYYSTDAGKLVYKDSGGTVNNLY